MSHLILTRGNLPLAEQPADALAVKDGRIHAVGSTAEIESLAGPATRRVDLGGRTLIPGFNDAHVHIWKVGHLLTSMLDLRGCDSIESLQQAVGRHPGQGWIVGRGYNEAAFREGRPPTRCDLDAASAERPVLLTRTCGHIAVANTRALQLARVTAETEPPPGGAILRDEQGQPTGVLQETAMGMVAERIPAPTAAEYQAMIEAGARHQIALGITSATEAGASPELLEVYRAMDARGELPYRVNVMAMRLPLGSAEVYPLPERHLSDRLRIDSIKLFADGGLSGATAALRSSYRHRCDHGLLRLDADAIDSLARPAHAAGLRIGVHAIGDAAIEAVLDAFERLQPPRAGHRIEHFGLPDARQLQRAANLGLIAVPQSIFLRELGENFRRYLGDELLERCYPLRSMQQAGLWVALSSDAPVVKDDNPLVGIQAAVTRQDASGCAIASDQALTPREALLAYTRNGAFASGDLDNRGTLKVGSWADLAVLSQDPTRVDPEGISNIRVEMTIVEGRVVYEP